AQTQNKTPQLRGQQKPAQIETLLRTAAQQLENRQFEPAYQSASRAFALSRQRGDKARQTRAANLMTIASFYTGRTNETIKKALLTADTAGLGTLQTHALSRAGNLLLITGRYEDALLCLEQGLQLSR